MEDGRRLAVPRLIVSEGMESLQMTCVGGEALFEFLRSGKKLQCVLPAPWLAGEPAWDDQHIWVPGLMGVYQIDRNTGRTRLLAHKKDVPCLDLLKQGDRLYVATRDGLYWMRIQ